MGPPSHSGVNSLRATRERLLRIGLTDEHFVLCSPPTELRHGLEPSSYGPEFGALVQRLQRYMRTGRGLSVCVTGARGDILARQHAALQVAVGMAHLGRQVILVDADFMRPGLGGLVVDPEAEGVLDVLRFGRSCSSLLQRPTTGGPAILPAGSMQADEPMPFGSDALRSLVYRVAQQCELALYVTPLPIRSELNPLARVCEHVIYALYEEDGDEGREIAEHLSELQKLNVHLAAVVLYGAEAGAGTQAAGTTPGLPDQAARPYATPPPLPPAFDPGFPGFPSEPTPGVPEAWAAPASSEEPAAWEPPAVSTPPPQPPGAPPVPSLWELPVEPLAEAWAERPLPAEEPYARPYAESPSEADREPSEADFGAPLGPGTEGFESEEPSTSAHAVPRTSEEARRVGEDLDLVDAEFAYDDDARYSRWPLYLVVALVVLIVGFTGWALWSKRGIESPSTKSAPLEAAPSSGAPASPGTAGEPPVRAGESPATSGAAEAHTTPPKLENPPAPDDNAAISKPPAPVQSEPVATSKPPVPAPSEPAATSKPPVPAPSEHAATPTPPAQAPREQVTTPKAPLPGAARAESGPAPAGASGAPEGETGYAVHVSSYETLEQSYKDIARLEKLGVEARAVKTDLGSKGVWYRVYVGSYPTRAAAEQARESILKLPGIDYAQVRPLSR